MTADEPTLVAAATTQGPGAQARPASVGRRARALLLTLGLFVVTLGIGWLAWSVVEWSRGRNPSYRLTGLRVVRRADRQPIGVGRSALREALCVVLMLPTLIACAFVALGFAMGASPPDGVLGQSRRAPWDVLTRTDVVHERPREEPDEAPTDRPVRARGVPDHEPPSTGGSSAAAQAEQSPPFSRGADRA